MGRINLKQLKEALNKLPDDKLEYFYLTHNMALEDCETPNLELVFYAEEELWKSCKEMIELEEFEVIQEFARAVCEDAIKVAICTLDTEKIEDYTDDTE